MIKTALCGLEISVTWELGKAPLILTNSRSGRTVLLKGEAREGGGFSPKIPNFISPQIVQFGLVLFIFFSSAHENFMFVV